MSWWITLTEAGETDQGESATLRVERFEDGGTHVLGGTDEATLNVTYNYGEVFATLQRANPDLIDFPKGMHNRRAADLVPALEWAVHVCGTREFKGSDGQGYWAPTPGNAGRALARLLAWARQYPDGTFVVH